MPDLEWITANDGTEALRIRGGKDILATLERTNGFSNTQYYASYHVSRYVLIGNNLYFGDEIGQNDKSFFATENSGKAYIVRRIKSWFTRNNLIQKEN